MTAEPIWENPLMPSAKLRQMYSEMLRLRMLSGRAAGWHGLEACLVSPVVDLGPEDLVCDALESESVSRIPRNSDKRKSRPTASSSCAETGTRLGVPASGPERLWAAVGAAATLRARAVRAASRDGLAVVCYARSVDASPPVWGRVLTHVSANRLPLLFVVLPESKRQGSRTGHMSKLAIRHHVPGMPVDQHDAVALYRVAHEAIGHARIGGGGALIECVRYLFDGHKRTSPDAIAELAGYMLSRQASDSRWIAAQEKLVSKQLTRRTAN